MFRRPLWFSSSPILKRKQRELALAESKMLRILKEGKGYLQHFVNIPVPNGLSSCTKRKTTTKWHHFGSQNHRILKQQHDINLARSNGLSSNSIFNCNQSKPMIEKLKLNTVSIVSKNDDIAKESGVDRIQEKQHILFLHGWGAGLGIWIKQLEHLSEHYNVHAIDMLGWGRSSRPKFPRNASAKQVQEIWVESIESWRKAMNIENLILVGHSMSGFLAASYAIKYKQNLDRLILLSPIGIKGFELSQDGRSLLSRLFVSSLWSLTPQRILSLIPPSRVRKMLARSRTKVQKAFPYDDDTVMEYVYRLTTTGPISGEVAFTKIMNPNQGWALPLKTDILTLKEQSDYSSPLPVSFVYGAFDWIDPCWAVENIGHQKILGDHANVFILPRSGHHGYIEDAELLSEIIHSGHLCSSSSTLTLNRTLFANDRNINTNVWNGPVCSLDELRTYRGEFKNMLEIS